MILSNVKQYIYIYIYIHIYTYIYIYIYIYNQRATGDHVPVPEDIRSIGERERDRVQEHIPVRALIFNPKAAISKVKT